jgi:hypothetical protein
MAVNLDKPALWKGDIARSVDMYNDWFMKFAPTAFRETRIQTTKDVESTLEATDNLKNISPSILIRNPSVLPTLRMSTCPPIALDRLIGLSGVMKSLVQTMEKKHRIPSRLKGTTLNSELRKIGTIVERMADPDIFAWLNRAEPATETEIHRAATIVADRLCGSVANPIIRNAQEKRQLASIANWLEARGYRRISPGDNVKFDSLPLGTYSFHMNVPVTLEGGKQVNIPIDAIIMPKTAKDKELPILIEAKSAGDFTNVNKRRKEEAAKMTQLRRTYGTNVQFNLFLCGYFDSGYLGYEAAEGIDWVWEHRIDDLAKLGL